MPQFAGLAISLMWRNNIHRSIQRNGHQNGALKRLETATLNDPPVSLCIPSFMFVVEIGFLDEQNNNEGFIRTLQ